MRDKYNKKSIENLFEMLVIGIGILILGFLSYYSLRFTTYFGMEYQRIPHFSGDSPVKNLLLILAVTAVGGGLTAVLAKIKRQKLLQSLLLGTAVLFILAFELWWIKISQTVPGADQRYVWVGAQEFMQGNYRYMEEGKYFQFYPHQLTFVMFCQMFMKLFGTTEFLMFKYFNAICSVVAILTLWKIFCKFSKKAEERIGFIIAAACIFPLFLYVTFIYSEIVSLTFMLLAFYFVLKFTETDRWYFGILCFVFMSLAVMCRKNMLIAVIALVLFLIMKFVSKKRSAYLILALLVMISSLSMGKIAVSYYENQSGRQFGDGVPSISFIGMGMQEGLLAEGWFNKFTEECYRESGYDAKIASEITMDAIRERIEIFKNDPAYCFKFYKNKILKQWNEPTYGGFINNSYHDERGLPEAANSMYYGELHSFFISFCNTYQLMIFLGALLFLIVFMRYNKGIEQLVLFVVFLGGFFFHILWEGDSRYAMPYFVLLIPYGVWGMSFVWEKAKEVVLNRIFVTRRNEIV